MGRCFWLLVLTLSCSAEQAPAPPSIRVFAASSLTDTLFATSDEFLPDHPGTVVYQFGSSSDLARQILAGASADIFFSADRRQMDRLKERGLIVEATDIDLLSNTLVVVAGNGSLELDDPAELTSLPRIAMADPEAVPAGVYAREYLESLGLWSELRDKVVPTLDVRAALAAVASGNVEAGFVYRTDAAMDERVRVVFSVPNEDGPAIRYSLGIVDGSDRAYVRSFVEFLTSERGSAVFSRFGFIVLPATTE